MIADTTLRVIYGVCIGAALAGLGHWAGSQAGYLGADRTPLTPLTTTRTYTADAGGRHFHCTEVIDHRAGSRSLGC